MTLFDTQKPVIGMIHVGALPGTPAAGETIDALEATVRREAAIYREQGVHGIMLENMHDVPYLKGHAGPEIVAAMTRMALAAKDASGGLPGGLQILAGANREALAVALAAGLQWIRAESFVFAHVADEGYIEASAGELLRYRRMIGAGHIEVWTDIKKKHSSHAITADVGLGTMAETVEFMRGSAVIVTGGSTGHAPAAADLAEARAYTRLPVLLGSGITADNLPGYFEAADGFIVGSHFKDQGHWTQPVVAKRVANFMAAWRGCWEGENE